MRAIQVLKYGDAKAQRTLEGRKTTGKLLLEVEAGLDS